MDLNVTKQITVDFYDNKYILINAKQYDEVSRFILVTCCNQGKVFPIDKETNFAYIRYKKADNFNVFNTCRITNDGKILVELTKQMLADYGRSYADLVIIHKNSNDDVSGEANDLFDVSFSDDGRGNVTLYASDFVDVNDDNYGGVSVELLNLGDMITEGKYSVLSTMTFCFNISATAVDNKEIESSNEYSALNDLMIKATDDYARVIAACKAYKESAAMSEYNADISEANAKTSETNAKTSEDNAKHSEVEAKKSETNAKTSENNAKTSETKAKTYETNAKNSEIIASSKALDSIQSATRAEEYANAALNSEILSQSYAVGGTSVRVNEDIDNSKYYYTQVKAINDSIGGAFLPMGTIQFEELQSVMKDVGYVYHIENGFATDDTFKTGAGISYPAGTNVYYTSDGYWDCFTGIFITDEKYNEMIQTVVKLQLYVNELSKNITTLQIYTNSLEERIVVLESQVVLGITE